MIYNKTIHYSYNNITTLPHYNITAYNNVNRHIADVTENQY